MLSGPRPAEDGWPVGKVLVCRSATLDVVRARIASEKSRCGEFARGIHAGREIYEELYQHDALNADFADKKED